MLHKPKEVYSIQLHLLKLYELVSVGATKLHLQEMDVDVTGRWSKSYFQPRKCWSSNAVRFSQAVTVVTTFSSVDIYEYMTLADSRLACTNSAGANWHINSFFFHSVLCGIWEWLGFPWYPYLFKIKLDGGNQPRRQKVVCFTAVPDRLSAKIPNDLQRNILKPPKKIN